MTKDKNKIKLLVLWDILCKNTDENHAMNSDEIREELAKRGISVMRKVVATDIDALNKYGYEVLSYKKKYYYYYDVSRPFTSDFYCATTWRRKANKSEGFHLYPKSILHLGKGKKIQYMKKSGQSLARISVSFRFHRLTFTPK